MKRPQAEPKSLEANLISLAVLTGILVVVLLVAIVAIEQTLSRSLSRVQDSIVPAAEAVSRTGNAVAQVFQRQAQVLSTRSREEFEPFRDRSALDTELERSGAALAAALGRLDKSQSESIRARLGASLKALLAEDEALFGSVELRHRYQEKLDEASAFDQVELQRLIQEAKAVSGSAHLYFVLALRRIVRTNSSLELKRLIHGGERVQQENAEQFVQGALHLGQLVGKIALARSVDELNSIAANELAQNLDRSRGALSTLLAALPPGTAVRERVEHMQQAFEAVAAEGSDASNPSSLLNLRRRVLSEAAKSVELREQLRQSVTAFSKDLASAQRLVSTQTETSANAARRNLWLVRAGMLAVFLVALWAGLRSARHVRASIAALRARNHKLASLTTALQSMNEGLEGLVAERSAELLKRERSMRLVLDAMDEALITIDLDGYVVGETSKAAKEWFGMTSERTLVWRYVVANDVALEERFHIGYQQVAQDLLPFEAAVDCLPRRIERDGRILDLNFRQVFDDGQFGRVLLVAKDITDQVASEARERDAREQQMLLANLLRDKAGFRAFVKEGESLLADLRTQPDADSVLRALHTLKGNTAVSGMESVARRCHDLEERITGDGVSLMDSELDELTTLWRARINKIEQMVTSDAAVELREIDYAEIIHGLRDRKDYDQLLEVVESWKWTATSSLLQRLARQAGRVAGRLNKPIEVRVEHNRLRVIPGPLDAFWGSLVHVVRNAMDHGLESTEERIKVGKPVQGQITVCTRTLGSDFIVELGDDGRGIDFDALERAAKAKGLVVGSRQELIQSMFHDGVTTRDVATELSGRGIGLAAVANTCRAAGGRIECSSEQGQGTTFRFVFPLTNVQVREASNSMLSLRPGSGRGVGLAVSYLPDSVIG